MAVKYFCDCCGKEVSPPKAHIQGVVPKPIATLEEINPMTGKTNSTMFCTLCLPELQDFIKTKQKNNGIIPIANNFNVSTK